MTQLPRSEYPRPQMVRDKWMSLNGQWDFSYDDHDIGLTEHWYNSIDWTNSQSIIVPFCYQSTLSTIGDTSTHDVVWYHRTFEVPEEFASKRLVLHFGAVDYQASVWVNGQMAVSHEGGHVPFSVDISNLLTDGANHIVVRAVDYFDKLDLPRGKQYWKDESEHIYYTRTTGIWQSVWCEAVESIHVASLRLTPNLDAQAVEVRVQLADLPKDRDVFIRLKISFKNALVAEDVWKATDDIISRSVQVTDKNDRISQERLWSPDNPALYDVIIQTVVGHGVVDEITSYFGMRKIAVENGQIYLNNFPFYMRLVLDQGYFPDGILTASSDEALLRDVELVKQMGFNGVRKHQKVEDPRFLYWCDQEGLVVWGEMANAYTYSNDYVRRMMREWEEVISRDYNHPCIVAWVPLNESWGVPGIGWNAKQQHHALSMYHFTKSLDDTRPVLSNDGWEHVMSDFCTIHDYEWRGDTIENRYSNANRAVSSTPGDRQIYVGAGGYGGEPIIVSEFGGIAYPKSTVEGWGYSDAISEDDFVERVRNVIAALRRSPLIQGYCYTQFTDVEQEINGLLTYDRKPKVALEKIREINLDSMEERTAQQKTPSKMGP